MQYDGDLQTAKEKLLQIATGAVLHSSSYDEFHSTERASMPDMTPGCMRSGAVSLSPSMCNAGEVAVTGLLQGAPGLSGVSRSDAAGFILDGVRNTLRGATLSPGIHPFFAVIKCAQMKPF